MNQLKYNIASREGEETSATVFIGAEQLLATKDHPNFKRILEALRTGTIAEADVRGLFNIGIGITNRFEILSERVSLNNGRIFFDADPVDDSLTKAILRFYYEGNDDFKPLVAFMEKIMLNPNEHSRQQLFRWLGKHDFGLAPDGDFIAYKGISSSHFSITGGEAIVNGTRIKGVIPNKPGTIIEMPRSQVVHNPQVACSTGLHAGNWRYARSFGQVVVRVKINPRDVVSVPTDSNDEKLRVSRYKVIDHAQAPDTKLLFPTDPERTARVVEPLAGKPADVRSEVVKRKRPLAAKKAGAKKPAKKAAPSVGTIKYPRYYEQMTLEHFQALPWDEIVFVTREWELKVSPRTRAKLAPALAREAKKRLATW